MKPLHRILLLAVLALFSAAALPAQHFISNGGSAAFNGFGGGFGGGFFGGYGGGYGGGFGYSDYGWGGGWGSDNFGGLHHPEEHAPFGVAMAHGDEDFEPSQYMDYNEAVALGKKILAEQAAPPPSLGEIARKLRAARHVSEIETKPQLLAITQDDHGKLLLYRTTT
jgi:hypothetical protein